MSVSDGRNPKNLEGRPEEENNSFRPREFFWDSVTLYVVSVIFALAAVDALTEFIRGSNVSCLVAPADNCSDKFSDSLNDYVREFCSAYVPSTEFFPAFIFVHALLIAIPHYLWLNHYGGNFDFFFAQASLLDRLRDEKTGKYSGNNRLILQQLTTAFSTYKKNWMFVLYLVKLSVQLLITLAGLIITIAVFTDFKTTFYCPENLNNNDPEFWPLNKRVICVFKSLRLFGAIQTANLILLCLLTNALIWSLLWCLSAHPTELGSQKEARFSFETGIAPDFYVPPLQLISCLLNFPFQSITRTLSRFLTSLPIPTLVGPKISTNLDFMVMKLFRTDSGLGHVFREMQVLQWIKEKEDHEQGIVELHKSQQASKVMADGSLISSIDLKAEVNWTIGKQWGEEGLFARDYETYPEDKVLVCVINFNPYYRVYDLDKAILSHRYASNIYQITCPVDVLSSDVRLPNKFVTSVTETFWSDLQEEAQKVDYAVVGPLHSYIQRTTVSLCLDQLSIGNIRSKALLISIQPTTIAGQKADTFLPYTPPPKYFQEFHQWVRLSNADSLPWPPEPPLLTPPSSLPPSSFSLPLCSGRSVHYDCTFNVFRRERQKPPPEATT